MIPLFGTRRSSQHCGRPRVAGPSAWQTRLVFHSCRLTLHVFVQVASEPKRPWQEPKRLPGRALALRLPRGVLLKVAVASGSFWGPPRIHAEVPASAALKRSRVTCGREQSATVWTSQVQRVLVKWWVGGFVTPGSDRVTSVAILAQEHRCFKNRIPRCKLALDGDSRTSP